MSNPPSAFDALMSGARAAGKNKPSQPSSSTNKRKYPHPPLSTPTSTLNLQNPAKPNKIRNVSSTLKERVQQLKMRPSEFNPSNVASWGKGEPVPFLFLSLAFDMISNETRRIVITDIVCNLLRTVIYATPEDLIPVVYFSANRIAPAHKGLVLGIGNASIIKALAKAYGITEAQIKIHYLEKGDLGEVAKASRSSQSMIRKPDALTIRKVFNTFRLIAKESGKNSEEETNNHIEALLVAATDCETKYLIHLLQTELRIGCAEETLLAALGQAAVYTEQHSTPPPEIQSPLEEASKIVKQVYSVLPDYDKIVSALLTHSIWKLPNTCNFTLGVPIRPMLSIATKSVSEALNKLQDLEFTCEYKYDGERAQIHSMENGLVEVYSRNGERDTGKFPDVVAVVSRLKKSNVSSFVLDCELVAYDRAKQKIRSFQALRRRYRKNVAMSGIKVDVCIFAFDLLYLNGQALLQENLKIRREHLYASFEEESGFFQFATAITSNDVNEIQKFLDKSVDASCEGLIIKTLDEDATYEPSKRSLKWLKLKKDYMKNIGVSLDLVPIAAFHGRGKHTGVYGAFLLACYDKNNQEFQSICKIGTGFSEEMLEELCASLCSKVIPKPKPWYRYAETINPDVWFETSEVWEVEAANLTISPDHCAAVGIVDRDKGISLRFPRLLRVWPDKAPEEASSSVQVARMYWINDQEHSDMGKED